MYINIQKNNCSFNFVKFKTFILFSLKLLKLIFLLKKDLLYNNRSHTNLISVKDEINLNNEILKNSSISQIQNETLNKQKIID